MEQRCGVLLVIFTMLHYVAGYAFNNTNSMCQRFTNCKNKLKYAKEFNCQCDSLCSMYGDCCSNSPLYEPGPLTATCKQFPKGWSIYVFTTCPVDWKQDAVRSLCEKTPESDEDPLRKTPVTSKRTAKTYSNIYCATCNSDTDINDLIIWPTKLTCQYTEPDDYDLIRENTVYSPDRQSWGINITEHFFPCSVETSNPSALADSGLIRECISDVIDTCSSYWNGTSVACESYTTIVKDKKMNVTYRNPDCAICNFANVKNLICFLASIRDIHGAGTSYSFAMLFDYMPRNDETGVAKMTMCQNSAQLYDPFFKTCRDIICSEGQMYKQGSCVKIQEQPDELNNSNNSSKNYSMLINCPKFRLSPDEFIMNDDNTSVTVKQYNKTYTRDDFIILSDGFVEICSSLIGRRLTNKFSPVMTYITLIGLGISIICLLIHLTAFILCPDLRNLSGNNLASLCLALLCFYVSYIAMSETTEFGSFCSIVGFATYYFLMASFSWSIAIGFDIWHTLRLATSQFKISSGKQSRKFFLYSIWSWFFPLLLLTLVCIAEYSSNDDMLDAIRPQVGMYSCWFGNRYSLLIFVAVPSGAIMVFNFIFACYSASLVIMTNTAANNSDSNRNVRLYVRLAILMGLSWSIGLAAGYFDLEFLWYLFIGCNTLQGLFIFFAFTYTKKTVTYIKQRFFTGKLSRRTQDRASTLCWPRMSASSTLTTNIDFFPDKIVLNSIQRSSVS